MPGEYGVPDRMVDWLYDQTGGDTSTYVSFDGFMAEAGISLPEAMQWVRELDRRGLVEETNAMGDAAASLTVQGAQEVSARRARRADPQLRAAAARNILLRWLYGKYVAGVHMPMVEEVASDPGSLFEGDRFATDEIGRAAEYLQNKGLITGTRSAWGPPGPMRAKITDMGQDCVDHYGGDVGEYIRETTRATPSITTHIGTVNNHGGALVVGSTDVTQNVTVGVDPAAMANFAKVLLSELGNLRLDAATEAHARDALDEVRREVEQPNPEPGRVTQAFGRFVGYIADAGKPVVTALLFMLARHHGLPPQ